MKKLALLILMFGLYVTGFAQEGQSDPKGRAKIQAARAAYITNQLGLTPEEAQRFWPVYNEFNEKRTEVQQRLRQENNDTRKLNNPSMTEEDRQKQLVELDLKIKESKLNLEKEYTKRLLETISAQKLMRLRRAENDFNELLIRQLQQRRREQQVRPLMRDQMEQRLRDRNN